VAELQDKKMLISLGPVEHQVGSRLTKMFLNHVHQTMPLFTFK